jgi:transcriptional regulator with XRE-family HTH domain
MEPSNNSEAKFADFAKRLSDAMAARDVSVHKLVGEFGVSPQAIKKWLDGATWPDQQRLIELAIYFRMDVSDLVGADEAKRRSRVKKVVQFRHPIDPDSGATVRRVQFKTPARGVPNVHQVRGFEEDLTYSLMDWAFEIAPHLREDAQLVAYPRVKGPLFTYYPDLMIAGDDGPIVAVEIKVAPYSSTLVQTLTGVGYNWRASGNKAPLLMVYVDSSGERDFAQLAGEAFAPLKNEGLFASIFTYPAPGPGVFDDIKNELARILKTPKPS